MKNLFKNIQLSEEINELLSLSKDYILANNIEELVELSHRDANDKGWQQVTYEIPGKGEIIEAEVCRIRNGIAANYMEPYMRRRDPECMVIADNLATDKQRYEERFGSSFDELRNETFNWLKKRELCIYFFNAGPKFLGMDAMVIAPANAGFFALGLGLLQGIIDTDDLSQKFQPEAYIFVAPPFRHTHFNGKQVVVHNRMPDKYEMFSYNLYPGPSAKKGAYSMLIHRGEQEGWVTLHCSSVEVITPYDNKIIFLMKVPVGVVKVKCYRICIGKGMVGYYWVATL